jgi:hypothetical protein
MIFIAGWTGSAESVYVLPLESNGGVNIIGLKIGTEVFDAGSIGKTETGGSVAIDESDSRFSNVKSTEDRDAFDELRRFEVRSDGFLTLLKG